MLMDIKVGFEIEAYIIRRGSEFHVPQNALGRFINLAESEDYRRIQPICDYMVEAKTFNPTVDITKATREVLDNLQLALNAYKEFTGLTDLELCCDSNYYEVLKTRPRDNIGTHIHLDFGVVRDYISATLGHEPSHEPIVWLMRQSVRKFTEKYCYSNRLRRRLAMAMNDLPYLTLMTDSRQTVNYRPRDTIEIAIADSTDNFDTLIALGNDSRQCLASAVAEYAVKQRIIPPSMLERERIMKDLLHEFVA